jgi:hypothetical protein
VLASGAFLFLAGLALVPFVAVAPVLKIALAVAWAGLCGREWWVLRRAYASGGVLRIASGGQVERQRRDGTWEPAKLCAGSVVLPRIAWLRVAPRSGPPYAELVRPGSDRSEDWRRLQVIWRHIGAA